MIRPGNPVPDLTDGGEQSEQSRHGQPRPEVEECAPACRRQPNAHELSSRVTRRLALVIPGLTPAPAAPLVPLRRSVGPARRRLPAVPARFPRRTGGRARRGDEAAAVLEITDVAPVAVPHRIRGRAWVAGWLTLVPGARLRDRHRTAPARGRRRRASTTCGARRWWSRTSSRTPRPTRWPPTRRRSSSTWRPPIPTRSGRCAALVSGAGRCTTGAIPVALDRFGLRVRFRTGGGSFDARFDFPAPVDGVSGAQRALRELFAAAQAG